MCVYVLVKVKQRLTESSLYLLGTSSRKSLKLTLGSVAGPTRSEHKETKHAVQGKEGEKRKKNSRQGFAGDYTFNTEYTGRRTDLVCWRVVTLSYRINSVQETAQEGTEE